MPFTFLIKNHCIRRQASGIKAGCCAAFAQGERYSCVKADWRLTGRAYTALLDDTRLVSFAMMDGLTFSAGTAGVDKGAEWHEQLNSDY